MNYLAAVILEQEIFIKDLIYFQTLAQFMKLKMHIRIFNNIRIMLSDVDHGDDNEIKQSPLPPLQLRKAQSSSVSQHTNHYLAFLMAIAASVSFVIMQFFLKRLTKNLNSSLVLGIRGSILFLCNLSYLIWNGMKINVKSSNTFRALIKRSIAGSLTLTMYLGSIKYIPVGIANALFNTMPIMTFFIEAFYYKKGKIHMINLAITVISFIGVILIIQPPFLFGGFAPDNYIFYFIVLFSSLTGSFSMLFLHQLRGKCNELIALQYNYFFQCISSYIILMFVNKNDEQQLQYIQSLSFLQALQICLLFVLLVLFAFTNQFLQTKSMFLCSSPALILPFSYVTVIVGLFLDVLIFDAKYNGLMIVGMIMASAGLFSKFILLHLQNKK